MGIRLFIDTKDQAVEQASVPVKWCLEGELLEQVSALSRSPFLLICVLGKDGYIEHRQAVPITDGMTYVQFNAPGENKIIAHVVKTDNYLDERDLKKIYLTKNNRRYNHDPEYIWSAKRKGWGVTNDEAKLLARAELSVEVPSALFAPEPPAWLKWYANLWHETRLVDQCHFRRRMIFGVLFKIWPVAVFILARSFMWVLTLLIGIALGVYPNKEKNYGCKLRMFYHILLHPFETDLSDIIEYTEMLVPIRPSAGAGEAFKIPLYLLTSPLASALPGLLGVQFLEMMGYTLFNVSVVSDLLVVVPLFIAFSMIFSAAVAFIAISVVFIFGLVLVGIVAGITSIAEYVSPELVKGVKKLGHAIAKKYDDFLIWLDKVLLGPNKIQDVACPLDGSVPVIKRSNVRLKFKELKSKVCKPMAW